MILLLVLVGGCGPAGRPPAGSGPTEVGAPLSAELSPGRWSPLPDVPLSPRENPVVAHVAGRVVVVGGFAGMPCPPNADCERAPTAAVGSDLYVLAEHTLLVWHGTDNVWDTVPVPGPASWSALVADGTRLVVAPGTDEYGVRPDRVLDTTTGEWETLPPNPLAPSFDRTVTATP